MSGLRERVLGRVADHLVARPGDHPLRVAVDGITAAGKTTLATELTTAIGDRGRPAIHLSMDGFHHPRAHRHRQGRDSAIGYYQDAYDFAAFARTVLVPLGPTGDRRYRTRLIDLPTDQPIHEPAVDAPADAILVVDGSFLQRQELANLWDDIVFVDTDFAVARDRGAHRDAEAFGGLAPAQHAFDSRYHAASRSYLAEVDPLAHATVVIGNDDVDRPVLRRIGGDLTSTAALFAYGTLQLPPAQLATFGRELTGIADRLPGYRTDRRLIIAPTGDPADSVSGTVFTLSTTDLAAADRYEVDDYRRVPVRLGSGTTAWVYLARDTNKGP